MTGAELIAAERERQQAVEGFTISRDTGYVDNELIKAAMAYLVAVEYRMDWAPAMWPWNREWFKPDSRLRMLEKAGALIAAEIDRQQAVRELMP